MKLICERIEDVQFISEAVEGSKEKRMYIEGVMLQAGIKNKNGRIYPATVMENEIARYTVEMIDKGRALGELGHPQGPTINQERACIRHVSLRKEGNDYIGKALVTKTGYGPLLQGLIEDGYNPGCSSRGLGSLKESNGVMEVQDDFRLATAADVVQDPSAPAAFVKGIMENTEWWYNIAEGTWSQTQIEPIHKKLKSMSLSEITDKQVSIFEHFVNGLLKK